MLRIVRGEVNLRIVSKGDESPTKQVFNVMSEVVDCVGYELGLKDGYKA